MSRTIASGLAALALTGCGAVALSAPANAASCSANGGSSYPPGNCPSAHVTESTQSPATGGSLTLDFTGLAPGSSLSLTLDTGQGFGTFSANSSGEVIVTITIPSGLQGTHTLTATGTNASGAAVSLKSAFTVRSASSASSSSGAGVLPFTGSAIASESAAGLGLLAAGTVAVVIGRRRRTVSR